MKFLKCNDIKEMLNSFRHEISLLFVDFIELKKGGPSYKIIFVDYMVPNESGYNWPNDVLMILWQDSYVLIFK